MARRIGWPNGLLAAVAAVVLVGCGVPTGYAPSGVPVYCGPPPAAPRPPAAPDSLTVVTWNIRYGRHLDRALAELRAHPRLAAADVLFLQEMDRAGTAALADSLGLSWVYGLAAVHPRTARPFGDAVLSRFPILDHRALVLPHATPVTGHHRIAVAADLDLGGGMVLRAVSVHTATVIVAQERRLAQAAAVLDDLGGPGPTVIAGDFNTVTAWDATLLRRAARRAGYAPVRLPPGPTIANRLGTLAGADLVLDHVFVRGLAAGGRGVVRTATASDHFPVWAVVARPRAGGG